MNKMLLVFSFLLSALFAVAQQDAWVFFTDKPSVASALADPSTILSQKAIDRKLSQGIVIDERDVPVNESYVETLRNQPNIMVMAQSKWLNAVHVRGSEADISAIEDLAFVEAIQFADRNLNSAGRSINYELDVDIEATEITFNYGNAQNQVEMISTHMLHQGGYTGEGLTIAVMDSGFPNVNTMAAFQRLRSNNDLLGGYDFVDGTEDVYAFSNNDHGTKVLSTMAGYIEDSYVGTAPDASYYLFRTEDVYNENPVEESYWVAAAERADSLGVDLINTSLGYTVFDNANYNYSPSDMDGQTSFISRGAAIASEKGILVVASAGNLGHTAWEIVSAPADTEAVFSIGAVDADENLMWFSSLGSTVPTSYQKPDVVAQGGSAAVIDKNNAIMLNNGTSFSGPIICGSLASLWQALPWYSAPQLKTLVRSTASQANSPDRFLGYGIPDFNQALISALSLSDNRLEEVLVYPNPAKQGFYLQNLQTDIDLVIYNTLGKKIKNFKVQPSANYVSIEGMAKGIYILKLKTQSHSKTLKLIKQ